VVRSQLWRLCPTWLVHERPSARASRSVSISLLVKRVQLAFATGTPQRACTCSFCRWFDKSTLETFCRQILPTEMGDKRLNEYLVPAGKHGNDSTVHHADCIHTLCGHVLTGARLTISTIRLVSPVVSPRRWNFSR
jgi:hypothetical protein